MWSAFKRQICGLIIATCALSLLYAADKQQLKAALDAVDANLKTSAGKQYDELSGKDFMEKYLPNMRQCKQSLPAGSSLDPFDVFVKLKADGQVVDALAYPETPLAICTRASLLNKKFSNPPHDEYWINIHLQLKH